MNLENQIEAILFFKNEPVSLNELQKLLEASKLEVENALEKLQKFYSNRGIVIVSDQEAVSLGTHPDASGLIEKLQKEELSRELGRAGLETLALILYKGLISRREIDHVRGVNSGFILRSLMVRGLIERADPGANAQGAAGRSYSYKATLKLLEYLGIKHRQDLPEFEKAFDKLEEFVKNTSRDQDE